MCTDSDLGLCNSYEDGTSTNREPRQAYKTAKVGHSQLWAHPWVMLAYELLNRTGNGFKIKFLYLKPGLAQSHVRKWNIGNTHLGDPTDQACWMWTCHRTLSGGACFVCVDSTEPGNICLAVQGWATEALAPLPTAESRARDRSDITNPSLVSKLVPDGVSPAQIKRTNTFTSNTMGRRYTIRNQFTCKTKNIVYLISCDKCNMQYVGETENALHIRMNGHRSDITTKKLDKPVATHFNQPDHSLEDLKVMGIEKIEDHNNSRKWRKLRKQYWIFDLRTLTPEGSSSRTNRR